MECNFGSRKAESNFQTQISEKKLTKKSKKALDFFVRPHKAAMRKSPL
jgi:hypothetical protein